MSDESFERRVRMRNAIGFRRMETDAELLERVRLKLGIAHKPVVPFGETADKVAERHGLERRIVEDVA